MYFLKKNDWAQSTSSNLLQSLLMIVILIKAQLILTWHALVPMVTIVSCNVSNRKWHMLPSNFDLDMLSAAWCSRPKKSVIVPVTSLSFMVFSMIS